MYGAKIMFPLPDSATNAHVMSSEWRENSAFMKHECDWGPWSDQDCNKALQIVEWRTTLSRV